jgi:hypothetical protein
MAAAGGGGEFDWSSLSAMGSFGAFLVVVVRWLHLSGKRDQEKFDMNLKTLKIEEDVNRVVRDLSDYKIEASRTFITRDDLNQVKSEIIQRLDRQDVKMDHSFDNLVSRVDYLLHNKAPDPT